MSLPLTDVERSDLLAAAVAVAGKAYAPYSGFRVGAAVLTERGGTYCGCNVENASYGLTMCAERAAICTAVADEGGDSMRIRAVAVVNTEQTSCTPCGACRQVIADLGPEALVLYRGEKGITEKQIAELLPEHFSLDNDR